MSRRQIDYCCGRSGASRSTRTTLTYRVEDPFAVTLTFALARHRPQLWTFARDLLEEGLAAPAGAGSVHLVPQPSYGRVEVQLGRPGRAVRIWLQEVDVERFLAQSFRLVPRFTEPGLLDLERSIARLLAR